MSVEAQSGQRTHAMRLWSRTEAERNKAFTRAERHSQAVRFLRIALPAFAAVTTAAYFISSSMSIDVGDVTASISGVQVANGTLRMTNPKLKGVDKKNGHYIVTADYAEQNVKTPKIIQLHAIRAELDTDGGGWSRITAIHGTFNSGTELLVMDKNIRIATSSGLTGKLTYATVKMKQQLVHSPKPVFFRMGDQSTVRSDELTMHTNDHTVEFIGHVKVHLIRKKQAAAVPEVAASAPETKLRSSMGADLKGDMR